MLWAIVRPVHLSRVMRKLGHKIVVYLNDFLCVVDTKESCEKTQEFLIKFSLDLGFAIN